ncbi:MAG: hypothetical protein ACJ8NS_09570 [Chthoniobacterales bacterium]
MAIAPEIEPVAPGLSLWRVYDPAVKAELYSAALTVAERTYLVDPVPLTPVALVQLRSESAVAGIVVTNENHHRAAAEFAEMFQAPIYLHDSHPFPPGLTAVPIEGAVPGEIALHSEAAGGVLIVGDALINFEPYGFTFLPAKYCSNVKVMRRSLPKLLDYSFERILFAHGTPILARAYQRLKQLLEDR